MDTVVYQVAVVYIDGEQHVYLREHGASKMAKLIDTGLQGSDIVVYMDVTDDSSTVEHTLDINPNLVWEDVMPLKKSKDPVVGHEPVDVGLGCVAIILMKDARSKLPPQFDLQTKTREKQIKAHNDKLKKPKLVRQTGTEQLDAKSDIESIDD